jgi:hypothetical protein
MALGRGALIERYVRLLHDSAKEEEGKGDEEQEGVREGGDGCWCYRQDGLGVDPLVHDVDDDDEVLVDEEDEEEDVIF